MSDFKLSYENQTGQFKKKRFEISIPILIPHEAMTVVEQVKNALTNNEQPEQIEDKKGKFGKKKKDTAKNEDKIQLSSLGMIAAATLLAALAKD